MPRRNDHRIDPIERTLAVELGLVRDAIGMVASRGASRVTVAGLHFGDQLLEPARTMALRSGVRIVPLWNTDESGADIMVERLPDDGG